MRVEILFGSESGNAEELAEQAGERLEQAGHEVEVIDMECVDPERLSTMRTALVITSTHGHGNPPYNAEDLHRYLMHAEELLPRLRFAVLGLGDTTYEHFARCGREFDRRLAELGARRILPRVDCDVDFDAPYATWIEEVVATLAKLDDAEDVTLVAPVNRADPSDSESAVGMSRRRPIAAEIAELSVLSGPGAVKDVRHVTLSLDAVLPFAPGDSFGITVANDPELVSAIADVARVDLEAHVVVEGEQVPLRVALAQHCDIVQVTARLTEEVGFDPTLLKDDWLPAYHVIDVLRAAPSDWQPQRLVGCLRRLQPRLYSIASSPYTAATRVDLMISLVNYPLHASTRWGVVSHAVAHRWAPGRRVKTFLRQTPAFHLPDDDDVPLIMIGAGTGVAPYRAFLQQRAARGATGGHWLFFGARHRGTDFFYEEDWRRFREQRQLSRMDLAFSRDQKERIYVQHRIWEQRRGLYDWLARGAIVYVCGDAVGMAPEVRRTLVRVMEQGAGISLEAAQARFAEMQNLGRYREDVY